MISQRVLNIICALPIINIVLDVFVLANLDEGSLFPQLRALFLILLAIYVFQKRFKLDYAGFPIILFLLYIAVLIPFSSKMGYSFRIYSKVFITLMMFFVGYYTITNVQAFKKLNQSMVYLMVFVIGYTIYSTIAGVGLGWYLQDEQFSTGYIVGSGLYPVSFAIILFPFIILFYQKKNHRLIVAGITIVSMVILLLSLRRTTVLSVVVGYATFFIFTTRRGQFVKVAVFAGIILTALFPYYQDVLWHRFESRFGEYESTAEAFRPEEQARYLETLVVYEEVLSFRNPAKSIFGKEIFNSPGNYGVGIFSRFRQLHIDYNIILHGSGLVGLLLYLFIFYRLYKTEIRVRKKVPQNVFNTTVHAVFMSLLFSTMFISMVGGMHIITFRSISFLYLGGFLGMYREQLRYLRRKRQESESEPPKALEVSLPA